MKPKQFLKKIFLGSSLSEEYICLEKDPKPAMNVYLGTKKAAQLMNVSGKNILLGYKPVIIGLSVSPDEDYLDGENEICLSFSENNKPGMDEWLGFTRAKGSVACLILKKVFVKGYADKGVRIYLFEASHGKHEFLNAFFRASNAWYQKITEKKAGNITLDKNLYEQVRIAYCVPRTVALVTLAEGDRMNMFPTDLHGSTNSQIYLSSLRIDGKAAAQVLSGGQVVLSELEPKQCKAAYNLGQRHMKDPEDKRQFSLSETRSELLELPLPQGAVAYYELEVLDYTDVGIHRVFMYRIIHSKKLSDSPVLKHAHAYYIQWLISRGIQAPVIWRH